MPIFNGERFLQHALDSLAAQETFDGTFEVIAADDGSSDGSRSILENEVEKKRFNLRIIEGAHRGNWVASTNKALKEAKGEYIVFLHQDDGFHPSRLRRLAEEAARHSDCAFFVNSTRFLCACGKKIGIWRPALKKGYTPPSECVPRLLVQNSFSVPGIMFRKSALEQCGMLDEMYKYTADWEFWLRLAVKYGVCFINETLSEFRVHPGSQTVSFATRRDEMKRNLEDVVTRYSPYLADLASHREVRRWKRLARLGVETNIFLASGGSHAPLPWKDFLSAFFSCPPVDWFRYAAYSGVVSRTWARVRAGFLKRTK